MSELVYYKTNVNYGIGVRADILDRKGMLLSKNNPYYAVRKEALRDFKVANKYAIEKGLIIETDEPSVDWDTTNAISDEKAVELVKNYLALKSELPKITSLPTMQKLLNAAHDQDRPNKTIKLIEARLEEIQEEENEITLDDMRGTEPARG